MKQLAIKVTTPMIMAIIESITVMLESIGWFKKKQNTKAKIKVAHVIVVVSSLLLIKGRRRSVFSTKIKGVI